MQRWINLVRQFLLWRDLGSGKPSRAKPTTKKSVPSARASQPAGNSKTTGADKPKSKISAEGLRSIIVAQKGRWAKVKAAKAQAGYEPIQGKVTALGQAALVAP